ncbi:MAG: CARDB domain-containing protein [Candidatus ainarchaeum sp.]|nr:CARDB domain-containing protein [Candidatus ainarchaeum sp.]
MKYGIYLGMIFLSLLAFAGAAHAEAALQVVDHTTIPETVYAGAATQLQMTIQNSGADSAEGVTIYYRIPGETEYSQIYLGDIGAGSTAMASVPFTVPQQMASGYFVVDLQISYASGLANQGSSAAKSTSLSIPIAVAQHQVLAVRTLSVAPQAVAPGGSITAQLEITNTGGVMNNAVISMPDSSSFSIGGGSQMSIGSVPFNSTRTVSMTLVSSSSAATGKYTVPVVVSYQDALQNTLNQTVSIGPVIVEDASSQMRVYLVPLTPTEVGSEAQFALTLENLGEGASSVIVDLAQSSDFVPLGPTRIYFDALAPGGNQTKIITVGVTGTLLTDYFNFPINITSNGNTYTQNIGVLVTATPDLIMSTQTDPASVASGTDGVTVSAQISNVGNGPLRSVYVLASSANDLTLTGTTDKFIGTLNVDDYVTFDLTVNVAPGLAPGKYGIPITIRFKDSKNEEQTITKYAEITVSSGQGFTGNGNASASGFRPRTNGAAGGNGIFGLGSLPLFAGALVVAVIGYFAYRKWKGGKVAAK